MEHHVDDPDFRVKGSVWWKIDISVLGISSICYLLSWLDRTNLGNARVAGLQKDLNLTHHQYSVCLTITFLPYILAELPSNLFIKVVGPHRLIPSLLILWGVATTLQGTVRNYRDLLLCRFFLGLFEGGLFPGIILYLSCFYPRERLQRRISLVLSSNALAGAFSGLLAASIVKMSGTGGKPGWAWIFILEGLFTVIFGTTILFIMPSSLTDCKLLTSDEKEDVLFQLRENGALSSDSVDRFSWTEVLQALQSPHSWLVSILGFFQGVIGYSLGYFAPSIIVGLGYSRNTAQMMSVPPYAASFIITNVASYFADRYHCRGLVIIVGNIICIPGFVMFLTSHNSSVQYGSLFLTTCGAQATGPAMMTWAANNSAPHVRRATAIALVTISINSGGILATWLLGYLSPAPRYTNATIVLLSFTVGSAICAAANVIYLRRQNNKKAVARGTDSGKDEPPNLGDRSANFIYIL